MKKNIYHKSVFILLIIGLVIFCLGTIFYYWSDYNNKIGLIGDAANPWAKNKPAWMQDWKTYTTNLVLNTESVGQKITINKTLEFKYPPDWKIKKYTGGSIALSPWEPASQEAADTLDIYPGLVVIGNIISQADPLSFTQRIGLENAIHTKKSEEFTPEQGPNPVFTNLHIITYQIEASDGWYFEVIYFSSLNNPADNDKYLGDFTSILSTFKFTN